MSWLGRSWRHATHAWKAIDLKNTIYRSKEHKDLSNKSKDIAPQSG